MKIKTKTKAKTRTKAKTKAKTKVYKVTSFNDDSVNVSLYKKINLATSNDNYNNDKSK